MTPGHGNSITISSLPRVWHPLLEFMHSHPQYEEQFVQCVEELFYGSGPLKKEERHYIALMAATRHRCNFLINLHEREFEKCGGDLAWLRGINDCTNKKLVQLDEINTFLAHQPWLCVKDCITKLTKSSNGPHFSLSELVHAVSVLVNTHALCSFVHAVGAVPSDISQNERLSMAERCEWLARDKENAGGENRKGEVEELLKRMDRLRAAAASLDSEEEIPADSSTAHFNALHDGNDDSQNGGESPTSSGDSSMTASVYRFSEKLTFSYIDFQTRTDSNTIKTFKIHEFSWEDHGFNLVDELYSAMAPIFDKKFQLTQNLTYKTMGGYENVDTTAYRLAVWNYIQALFGIRHDDYDYSEVNTLLSREMKTFVKTVACFPHRVTDTLRQNVMCEFKASEKIHVMLMIMESRMQASMLYFTRALTNYYSSDIKASLASLE